MKTFIVLIILFILGCACQLVFGGQVSKQTYTDKRGTIITRAYTNSNGITRYYDSKGNPQGFSIQQKSRVNYYDKHSNRIGSATQIDNGFRYFNNQGKPVGQSKGK